MTSPASLSLRPATSADAGAVAYLSELDEAERLTGSVLMAFDGDRPVWAKVGHLQDVAVYLPSPDEAMAA